jgi:hypothetical protein
MRNRQPKHILFLPGSFLAAISDIGQTNITICLLFIMDVIHKTGFQAFFA